MKKFWMEVMDELRRRNPGFTWWRFTWDSILWGFIYFCAVMGGLCFTRALLGMFEYWRKMR